MPSFKNTVSQDVNLPQFWVSTVSYGGQSVAVFYGDSKAEATSKGNEYIKSQSRSKQVIGEDAASDDEYTTIAEVLRAFNECKLTFRQASTEMKRINPSLSENDLQNIIIDDNPSVPDCDGDGVPSGEDTDGDLPPADDYSWWPLTEENRFMLIGVLVIYLLYYYGRN